MQQVLREAMDAGAAGFATSFAIPHRGDRRQAGAEPVRRPGRARGAARDDGGGRPRCGVDRARRAVPAGRHVRPADEGRRAVHVGRAPHVAHRVPPPGARGEPGRVGARRRGVAAGDAAAAHLPVHPRLAVPARGQRALRRAAERVDRRAHSGLRRPRVARADDERLERDRHLRSPLGHLHHRPERSAPRPRRPEARRRRRRARHGTARLPARPRARGARTRRCGYVP